MEKSKPALRISIMIMALMVLFPVNAFADSSWVWISEKRPFDILPWVAMGTILIEWLSIWLIPRTGHAFKVLGIVMVANALLTLLVEMPIVYNVLKSKVQDKKKLQLTIIISNMITTAGVAIIERLITEGYW